VLVPLGGLLLRLGLQDVRLPGHRGGGVPVRLPVDLLGPTQQFFRLALALPKMLMP
jgi:hypothetical protein